MSVKKLLKNIAPHGLVRLREQKSRPQSKSLEAFQADFDAKAALFEDNGRFVCNWADRLPCLDDATEQTGFDPHYTYHPAWAARIVATKKPAIHYDISSSLAFVSMLSAFVPVAFFDYRPAALTLSGLSCERADLLNLHFADSSIESLSCMHVVEHVGLERYGDSFDPQGDLKAMHELARVLKPEGTLLFVVPVGAKAIIQYNAHRIYTYDQVVSAFTSLQLESFAFIKDNGTFLEQASSCDTIGQRYGCGCFCFTKKIDNA
ncbi:MAG: hypothetical protein DELT_01089 [Desulfovibrio sp.]